MAGKNNYIDLNNPELIAKDLETKKALETIPEDVVNTYAGIGNRRKIEKVPAFNKTSSEKVFQDEGTDQNHQLLVMGELAQHNVEPSICVLEE